MPTAPDTVSCLMLSEYGAFIMDIDARKVTDTLHVRTTWHLDLARVVYHPAERLTYTKHGATAAKLATYERQEARFIDRDGNRRIL